MEVTEVGRTGFTWNANGPVPSGHPVVGHTDAAGSNIAIVNVSATDKSAAVSLSLIPVDVGFVVVLFGIGNRTFIWPDAESIVLVPEVAPVSVMKDADEALGASK